MVGYNRSMSYTIRRPLTLDERNRVGGASDIVAHLLFHRGITDAGVADTFLMPSYDAHVHDPFLLKDAERAAERFISAIQKGERIAIYSDYDADGIPAAVMFDDFLKRIGYANYTIYIPHRHNEGFGVNEDAVEQLATDGVKLMITLDCGISDVEPVKRANERGIHVIITDHHEPPAVLPPAFAIIDHKQADCEYPDKHICGSGVGFKLIQAIIKKAKHLAYALGNLKDGHEKWLLDMVGIATLSDMVPLTGENRVFARYGLSVLRKSPRKGLMRLLAKLKMNQAHLTEDDIAFMITPRINAASRMGVPMDAFKLLAADNDTDAEFYATHLDEINNERKGIVAALVKEIKKTVRERYGETIPSVIVLGNPDWKPSLLGLAANSCAEEFDRPVFLWGRDGDDVIKGSCRSEGKSNVVEIMRGIPSETFLQFGGHKHSGGFAVANERVHFLEKELNEAAVKINSKFEILNPKQIRNSKFDLSAVALAKAEIQNSEEMDWVDMELKLEDVTWNLQEDIDRLSPFGMGNPKPLFIFKNVRPAEVRMFGKAKDHVELVFKKKSGASLSAIAFFGGENEWAQQLIADKNREVDLIASIEKSMFRGRKELRLRVEEVLV